MNEYKIPPEVAYLVAVGIYREIGAFIKSVDPKDYESFKAEHENRKIVQALPSVMRQ